MNAFRVCIPVLMALLAPGPGLAQDTLRMTLEESAARALAENRSLMIAGREAEKAHAARQQATATLLPRVDGYASLQHAWEIQTNRIPNFLKPMLAPLGPVIPGIEQMPDFVEISFGLENTVRYGAMLTQPVFLGGAGWAAVRSAGAAVRAADQQYEARRQQVLLETVRVFHSALLAREIVAVQEEALAQARANFDLVLKKYDVGMASRFDRMRAEVEVARLEPEVLAARNNYEASLTLLKSTLGLDLATDVEPVGKLTVVRDELAAVPLDELQTTAISHRPELRGVREQRAMAEEGIVLARSELLPKLFFQTDYSYLAMKDNLKLRQDDFSKGFTSSLSLQIPIFHGFESRSRLDQAHLNLRIVEDMDRQARDAVNAEVEISHLKLNEAAHKVEAARKTVELASEALRLAAVLYEEGANTQLDVLSSRLALTSAKLSDLNASYEHVLARYQLRKAIGSLTGILEENE